MSSSRIVTNAPTFGALLKQLRRRVGMTQGELAALVGFSVAMISRLEQNERLPDLAVIGQSFLPALGLHEEPRLAHRLLELAAAARGERLPAGFSATPHIEVTRQVEVVIKDEILDNLHLPTLPTRVIGREPEVSAIGQRLLAAPGRLVTLVGPPGVGKTTLAIATAAQIQPFFPAGVWFVPLATLFDPAQLAATLASALDLGQNSPKPLYDRLVEHLRRKTILLVLDNFEQLLTIQQPAQPATSVRLLADLLNECPQLRLLVTSREPLRLRAEQRQPIQPLPLAAALALFVERAQAVAPDLALTASNQTTIATLCTQLDCLPLAIELIAAQADLLTPAQMLDRLQQQPLDLLQSDLHDLPERHRTLVNAIQYSYTLLNAAEQHAFRAVGVFVGGFALAAAAALGVAEATVQALVKKSLVRNEQNPTAAGSERFALLETVRHFALAQLTHAQEELAQRLAHCRYFAHLAQEVFVGVRGADQAVWLQQAHRDHDNFRAALRFALAQQDGEQAVAIAGGLWWFWYRQGFINEARGWLAAVLQIQPAHESATAKRWRANACNGAGSMASEQSDYAAAIAYFQAGMALFTELDDVLGMAIVLHNMGLVASGQGDFAQALRWLEDSLTLERQHRPDNPQLALGMANIGITAYEMGDLALALRWLEEAWPLAQQEGDGWAQAFIAGRLAEVLRLQGDLTRAAALANASLQLYTQLADRHYLPEPTLVLAHIALAQGDLPTARTHGTAVLQQYTTLNDDHGVANALHLLAQVVLAQRRDPAGAAQAARLLGCAIHLRSQYERQLSIPEQNARAELLALLAVDLGPDERDRLIQSAAGQPWVDVIDLPA